MEKYYIKLLPSELQTELILFIGLDVNSIDNLCRDKMINTQLCSENNPIWKKLSKYHITSNINGMPDGNTKRSYFFFIRSIMKELSKNTQESQRDLIVYLNDEKADILLKNLLEKYPYMLDDDTRIRVLRDLIYAYIDIEPTFPLLSEPTLNFLPIILQNNARGAPDELIRLLVNNRPSYLKANGKLNDLFDILLPKISKKTFIDELEYQLSMSVLGPIPVFTLLDKYGLSDYFREYL